MPTSKTPPPCKGGAPALACKGSDSKPLGAPAPSPKPPPHGKDELRFIEERQYLKNVTPKTLSKYHDAFNAFKECSTEAQYKARVVQLRQRGLSPVSINTWLRTVNAFQHWRSEAGDGKCSSACKHIKLAKLKEDTKVLSTLSLDDVRTLLGKKPSNFNWQRVQVLAALVLDTGLRVAEALNLRRQDVDLDGMQVIVMGKGRKERRVPISQEGRKWLFTWLRTLEPQTYVFATSSGTALSIRNAQRDLRAFCQKCGVEGVRCSPHTFRHTFAVSYLRAGGNLEYLRRILGHSSILITQRYLESLQPEDLGRVHNTFSPLSHV